MILTSSYTPDNKIFSNLVSLSHKLHSALPFVNMKIGVFHLKIKEIHLCYGCKI
jgi:hypothetical protein